MNLEKNIAIGLLFNILSKYSNVLIQIILMIILARFLSPETFGEIALVFTFLIFFNYFGNLGLSAAIVQKDNLSKDEIQEAFIFTILLGVFLAGIYILFSNFLKNYYNSDIFINTKFWVSIIIFFNCLNTIPSSILRKNLKFKIISINEIVANIFSAIVAIILAFMKFGIYAVIFQNFLRILLLTILNIIFSKVLKNFKSRLNFSFLKKIYGYSSFELLTNILNYFSRSADNILIGKYLGFSILGYYDRAYRLILFPIKNFTHLLTPILHPIFVEYKDERKKLYEYYIKISKIMILLGLPISIFIYFNSESLIYIIYGDKWFQSFIYLKILSVSLIPQMLNGVFQAFYLSTDNTKKMFLTNIFFNGILVSGIIIGIYLNSLIVIICNVTFGYIMKFFVDIFILNKIIFNISNKLFFSQMKSVIYILIITILSQIIDFTEIKNIYFNFSFKGIMLLIFYITSLKLTGELNLLKYLRRPIMKNKSLKNS